MVYEDNALDAVTQRKEANSGWGEIQNLGYSRGGVYTTDQAPYDGKYLIVNYPKEKDPNGKDLKAGGAKADDGKVSVTRGALHYFPRAITAVAELSTIGARKYSWKGWETVPDGINRYGDALGRHELKIEADFTKRDSDTGVLEATAVAWNALARLELILREQEKKCLI